MVRIIQYNYKEIIDGLNSGKIKTIRFCVNNYSHYKNCVITRTEQKFPNNEIFFLIEVTLTKDSSEKISFFNSFDDNTKLFHMGRKGRFTLKQLWPQITILEIVHN